MKVFRPNEVEFADPVRYIESLYKQGVWKYGCIKIIPPSSFEPPFSFNTTSDRKLPTRFQTLQDLSQGKAFIQNEEGMTFKDFKKMADGYQDKHFAKYHGLSQKERTIEIEKEYWTAVEDNIGDRIQIQYAADLSARKFGSGFPQYSDNEYTSHPWNLNYMDELKNSMLQICKDDKMSGVNIPWLYIGMLFSSF
jgi:hypothetical protein